MALTDENGSSMVMPVAPMYGGNGNNGFGFGGDWAWILLLLVLFGGNGWGMGGGFDGGLYPWMNQSNQISGGFRDQMLNSGINGIQSSITSGFGDVQTALCSGFASTSAAVTGAQNALSQQMYSNELASLNRSFAEQTANTAGFNGVQSALCDIRYGSATNTRDIIDSQTRGTQAILDKLCQVELDGYKRENDQLRTQLNMAQLSASQTAQNAFISQGFANEVDALYNRLNSCPVPTTPVYGRTPIFTCNNGGCGCGNSGFVG